MNILLNILVFFAFLSWFWKQFVDNNKKSFIGIVFLFLLSSMLLFGFSLYAQHDYLDGTLYLAAGGVSILAFWIYTSAIIIWKNVKDTNRKRLIPDLLQVLPLLLIPLLIVLLFQNMSFKIGG